MGDNEAANAAKKTGDEAYNKKDMNVSFWFQYNSYLVLIL